ncbi:MAG: hypothetical protein ACYTF7_06505 [Planctomycetota bacterium]|jgi:hypothetical protein
MRRLLSITRRVVLSRLWFVVALVMVGLSIGTRQRHTLLGNGIDFLIGSSGPQQSGAYAVICDVNTEDDGTLVVRISERAPRVVNVTEEMRRAERGGGEESPLPVFDSSILVSLTEVGFQGVFHRWHPGAMIYVRVGDWIVREGQSPEQSVAESRHPSTSPDRRIVWRIISEDLSADGASGELIEQAAISYRRVMLAGTDNTNWDTIRWGNLVLEIVTLVSLFCCTVQLVGLRGSLIRRRRIRQGKCPICQYSLDGIVAEACSECGTAITHPSSTGALGTASCSSSDEPVNT